MELFVTNLSWVNAFFYDMNDSLAFHNWKTAGCFATANERKGKPPSWLSKWNVLRAEDDDQTCVSWYCDASTACSFVRREVVHRCAVSFIVLVKCAFTYSCCIFLLREIDFSLPAHPCALTFNVFDCHAFVPMLKAGRCVIACMDVFIQVLMQKLPH